MARKKQRTVYVTKVPDWKKYQGMTDPVEQEKAFNACDYFVHSEVSTKEADDYFNSRPYKNRIGAWASSQSKILDKRETFLKNIQVFEKKYPDEKNVPRPPHWSGWRLLPDEIEFWLDGEGRIHERLNYKKNKGKWEKELLYP